MIKFETGDIFEDTICDAIVNPVNCKGISGAGLALQFKQEYPEMFAKYRRICENKGMMPGSAFLWKNTKWPDMYDIICLATKDHWKNPSKLEWIEQGLSTLHVLMKQHNINGIGLPKIGAGLGGLKWTEVKNMIIKFHDLKWQNKNIVIYE